MWPRNSENAGPPAFLRKLLCVNYLRMFCAIPFVGRPALPVFSHEAKGGDQRLHRP